MLQDPPFHGFGFFPRSSAWRSGVLFLRSRPGARTVNAFAAAIDRWVEFWRPQLTTSRFALVQRIAFELKRAGRPGVSFSMFGYATNAFAGRTSVGGVRRQLNDLAKQGVLEWLPQLGDRPERGGLRCGIALPRGADLRPLPAFAWSDFGTEYPEAWAALQARAACGDSFWSLYRDRLALGAVTQPQGTISDTHPTPPADPEKGTTGGRGVMLRSAPAVTGSASTTSNPFAAPPEAPPGAKAGMPEGTPVAAGRMVPVLGRASAGAACYSAPLNESGAQASLKETDLDPCFSQDSIGGSGGEKRPEPSGLAVTGPPCRQPEQAGPDWEVLPSEAWRWEQLDAPPASYVDRVLAGDPEAFWLDPRFTPSRAGALARARLRKRTVAQLEDRAARLEARAAHAERLASRKTEGERWAVRQVVHLKEQLRAAGVRPRYDFSRAVGPPPGPDLFHAVTGSPGQ